MTHFIVLSPVFPPELVVSAKTTADVARELTLCGHPVTVFTAFPNRPAGRLFPGYKRRPYATETPAPGLRITRCFAFLSPESRLASRLLENASFGITSSAALLFARRPEAIYANTWPVIASGMTALVARLRRIPLVISIQDVYPESLVSQGRLDADGRLAALMTWIDGKVARSAAGVIVISESFARIYREERKVPPGRLHVIANWGEATAVPASEEGAALRDEMGIAREAFVVAYGGNVGAAAGVEGVIAALGELDECERPRLLIAGSGSQLDNCRAFAARIDPVRICFYSPWPAEKTAALYASADLLVLPTRGAQSLASAPSKLISYMLAGRPVLAQAIGASDMARTIEESGCGWVVEPNNAAALAGALQQIRSLPESERKARGEAGRRYALRHLTRETCLPRVIETLEAAAQRR